MRNFLILAVVIIAATMAGCHDSEHEKHENTKFIATTPVFKDTLIYKKYVCQIRSIQHIELRALEKGYLQNIYVDEGQHVKKGQLMFQITPLIYQAETEKARAEVNFAEIEYQNTKSLAEKNIVSPNELALAKAKLDKAKAELSLASAHMSFTEVHAPFDGIMDRFQVRLGSLLDEGDLLTTLSDNSSVWVYFNVPEAEYLDFATNHHSDSLKSVKLQMANNELFSEIGKVETIEADFNNETGNIAFRAIFPNPGGLLRHGETGNILMPADLKNALIIPQKATFEILDKKFVYVIGADNTVQSREIKVSMEMPHLYVVSEGLTTNDKILVEGLRKVKNNDVIDYELKPQESILSDLNNLHAE